MRRRQFIALLGAAATTGFPARAQRAGTRRIGVLLSGLESDPDSRMRIAAFRRGLADLGWKEGETVQVEYRWAAGKSELIALYAAELVALAPDVILANSTPVLGPAAASATITWRCAMRRRQAGMHARRR